ncbi:hypothetical protein D3C81_1764190 [compost metagenome]
MLQNTVGEGLRRNHRALDMQMDINQAWHYISAFRLNDFPSCERLRAERSHIEETPLLHGDIRRLEPFIVTVVHFSVQYKLICNHHVCSL